MESETAKASAIATVTLVTVVFPFPVNTDRKDPRLAEYIF